jgi:mono/diheme cytochrome c family protein
MLRWILLGVCFTGWLPQTAVAQADNAAARGKQALEGRAFIQAPWTAKAYENAWKQWTPKRDEAPADYDKAFADYYGLHPAPYQNGRYPMGLRAGPKGEGLTYDCMTCHGGSILGKSHVGLGNASLDLQALFEDMQVASGKSPALPCAMSNVRGTNEAFGFTEIFFSLRNPDLSLRAKPIPWKVRDDLCDDVPAWWHLKRKTTMYHSGSHNADSVRTNMQFMLEPGTSADAIKKEEETFRDIRAYLLSLEAPKYPADKIKKELVQEGYKLFSESCAKCHGTYGADAKYPNKLVSIKVVGTDATQMEGLSKQYVEFYNQTWFAEEKGKGKGYASTRPEGYVAPPLDGVWATAPYLHNGSLPTLYDVLNSKTRPKLFKRSFATADADYDHKKVGWKVEVLEAAPKGLVPYEQRKIYDTTQPGRGNGGHTFGDDLTEPQRWAIIEYLKTL